MQLVVIDYLLSNVSLLHFSARRGKSKTSYKHYADPYKNYSKSLARNFGIDDSLIYVKRK